MNYQEYLEKKEKDFFDGILISFELKLLDVWQHEEGTPYVNNVLSTGKRYKVSCNTSDESLLGDLEGLLLKGHEYAIEWQETDCYVNRVALDSEGNEYLEPEYLLQIADDDCV